MNALVLEIMIVAGTSLLPAPDALEALRTVQADPNEPALLAQAAVPGDAGEAVLRWQALRRRVSHAGIASVAAGGDPNAAGLLYYIRQLDALQVPARETRTAVKAPLPKVTGAPESPKSRIPASEPNRLSEGQDCSDKLDTLLKNPADVMHALAAAEALFEAHDYRRAAAFYRIALERMTASESEDAERVAWALFQLANCLRTEDPAGATGFYEQLAAKYPGSPWTAAAAVECKLIAWRSANRPEELLEKYARDPNSL